VEDGQDTWRPPKSLGNFIVWFKVITNLEFGGYKESAIAKNVQDYEQQGRINGEEVLCCKLPVKLACDISGTKCIFNGAAARGSPQDYSTSSGA